MSANKGYRRPETRTLRAELELHHEEEQEIAQEWRELYTRLGFGPDHYGEPVGFDNVVRPGCDADSARARPWSAWTKDARFYSQA